MVAQAAVSHLDKSTTDSPIKLLDLLTNRYHVGLVRDSSESGLEIELPASTHFAAGQRVRFAVGDQPLVARNTMRRGFITQVSSHLPNHLSIRLALIPETAVA